MNRLKRSTLFLAVFGLLGLTLWGCTLLNDEPVAVLTRSPASGDAPLAVFFDATTSYDLDGILVHYNLEFGDGLTAAASTATHIYESPGTYEVTLTVTDDRGEQSRTTRMITVFDPDVLPTIGSTIGQLAPPFTLRSFEQDPISLADYRGYVILLDFWSSTCTPCRETLPHLEGLRAKFADQGLVVIAVNLDESEIKAREFLSLYDYDAFVTLRGSLSAAEAVRDDYDVAGIPHTFVIDRQGVIRHRDHPIRLRDRHIEPWL